MFFYNNPIVFIAIFATESAAKASIKQKTDEYKKLLADGKQADARKFRERNQKYFAADAVIQQQSRMISTNKKLLGKGSDSSIMRLIGNSRNVMLKAIDRIE